MRFILMLIVAGAAAFLAGSSESQAQPRWVPCATEGEFCDLPYPSIVRYGAHGRFAERRVGRGVPCTNRVFGDPVFGVRKRCFYLARGGGEEFGEWERCAREGGYCDFRGRAVVRYGARGAYAYRRAFNGIACNNAVFGDPLVGVGKHCEVRR